MSCPWVYSLYYRGINIDYIKFRIPNSILCYQGCEYSTPTV